jgi:hypothetical protein
MNQEPERGQQPQPPHQYPQYAYPPPKKDDKKDIAIIAVVLIVVFLVILVNVLYVLSTAFSPSWIGDPTGEWGPETIVNNTEVHVEFDQIVPAKTPMHMEIILVRNGAAKGKYSFTSNGDGPLILASGTDVGTLWYDDRNDNGYINIGDSILLTGLSPQSSYELRMIFVHTGNQIATMSFSTPP